MLHDLQVSVEEDEVQTRRVEHFCTKNSVLVSIANIKLIFWPVIPAKFDS